MFSRKPTINEIINLSGASDSTIKRAKKELNQELQPGDPLFGKLYKRADNTK